MFEQLFEVKLWPNASQLGWCVERSYLLMEPFVEANRFQGEPHPEWSSWLRPRRSIERWREYLAELGKYKNPVEEPTHSQLIRCPHHRSGLHLCDKRRDANTHGVITTTT